MEHLRFDLVIISYHVPVVTLSYFMQNDFLFSMKGTGKFIYYTASVNVN